MGIDSPDKAIGAAVSARMLLECVQKAEDSGNKQLQSDGESLRSWLVYRLKFRTIRIPPELMKQYERVLNYYTEYKQ